MNSFFHPNIQRTDFVNIKNDEVCLISNLASCDMRVKCSQLRKKTSGNYIVSFDLLKRWCFSIAQAVYALHKENIIHGDIKASNVLYFDDKKIKLTDFTLAVKKTNGTFRHVVCTYTYRPLEVFFQEEWDEKVDIWSLGCLFFDFAFGEQLFCSQEDGSDKTKKAVNALYYWQNEMETSSSPPVQYYPCDYRKPRINYFRQLIQPKDSAIFLDLLKKMLCTNKNSRLNIEEVIKHEFFTDFSIDKHRILKPLGSNRSEFLDIITEWCSFIPEVSEELKQETCIFMIEKITNIKKHNFTQKLSDIHNTEILLCQKANFRLLF